MADLIEFITTGPGGNIANVVGLLISIIGFIVTIITVVKSKTAAEQAREASLKVREDIQRIDTVSDLSKAISIMEEIRRLHREQTWVILPDRYSELKRLLISIKAANDNLSNEQKTILQSAIQQFTNIDNQIERVLYTQQNPTNIHKLNAIVGQQVDNLGEILVEIRNSIGM